EDGIRDFHVTGVQTCALPISPAVAERIGLESYHFVTRQFIFMIPAIAAMLVVSFFNARQVRRLALFILLGSLVLMVVALYFGVRSEERRVGKERESPWWAVQL